MFRGEVLVTPSPRFMVNFSPLLPAMPVVNSYCPNCGFLQPDLFSYWPCQRCGYDVTYLSSWLYSRPLLEDLPSDGPAPDPAVVNDFLSRSKTKKDGK